MLTVSEREGERARNSCNERVGKLLSKNERLVFCVVWLGVYVSVRVWVCGCDTEKRERDDKELELFKGVEKRNRDREKEKDCSYIFFV